MPKRIRKRSIARHAPTPQPELQPQRTCSHAIDAVWQTQIRARMAELGVSQAELARRVGSSAAAMTLLFKPETTGSTFVSRIHTALNLAPPLPTRAIASWSADPNHADTAAQSAALRGTGGQG